MSHNNRTTYIACAIICNRKLSKQEIGFENVKECNIFKCINNYATHY